MPPPSALMARPRELEAPTPELLRVMHVMGLCSFLLWVYHSAWHTTVLLPLDTVSSLLLKVLCVALFAVNTILGTITIVSENGYCRLIGGVYTECDSGLLVNAVNVIALVGAQAVRADMAGSSTVVFVAVLAGKALADALSGIGSTRIIWRHLAFLLVSCLLGIGCGKGFRFVVDMVAN